MAVDFFGMNPHFFTEAIFQKRYAISGPRASCLWKRLISVHPEITDFHFCLIAKAIQFTLN
jgi:hypothetical protein